jgi:hypothetical protein
MKIAVTLLPSFESANMNLIAVRTTSITLLDGGVDTATNITSTKHIAIVSNVGLIIVLVGRMIAAKHWVSPNAWS